MNWLTLQPTAPTTNWLIPVRIPMEWEYKPPVKVRVEPVRYCKHCGKVLGADRKKSAKYCNTSCAGKDNYRVTRVPPAVPNCVECGKPNPYSAGSPRRYCCKKCQETFNNRVKHERRKTQGRSK